MRAGRNGVIECGIVQTMNRFSTKGISSLGRLYIVKSHRMKMYCIHETKLKQESPGPKKAKKEGAQLKSNSKKPINNAR